MDTVHKRRRTRSTTKAGHVPHIKKVRIDFVVSSNVLIFKSRFAVYAAVNERRWVRLRILSL